MAVTNRAGNEALATPCIEWDRYRNPCGYGQRWFRGKLWLAHRAAYTEQVGELEPGQVVRHRCDNPSCINVDHLVAGSQSANMVDRIMRSPRASNLKLRSADVLEIKRRLAAGHNQAEIAKQFGVDKTTISKIHRGLTWSYLPNNTQE